MIRYKVPFFGFLFLLSMLLIIPSEAISQEPIRPGDPFYRDNLRSSMGFFVEDGENTYMIITAHQILGWDGWAQGHCPEGQVYSIDGREIGEFYSWGCYSQYGPGTDVAAIKIYPEVDVSNEVNGVQPLGFIYQERDKKIMGRGMGGSPIYGTSFGTSTNKQRANARLPGVKPGFSGSAIYYLDPPAITGVVHGGYGNTALVVSGHYSLSVLGLDDARIVGGLPDNVVAFGDVVVSIDDVFFCREAQERINQAIANGYDYAVLHMSGIVIPIWQ